MAETTAGAVKTRRIPAWEESRLGGGTTLTLCRGLITASVSYACTGERGYVVRILGNEVEGRFPDHHSAKQKAERLLESLAKRLQEDLKSMKETG
jgi:hypothetical protein